MRPTGIAAPALMRAANAYSTSRSAANRTLPSLDPSPASLAEHRNRPETSATHPVSTGYAMLGGPRPPWLAPTARLRS